MCAHAHTARPCQGARRLCVGAHVHTHTHTHTHTHARTQVRLLRRPRARCPQILDTAHKLREQEWEYDMEASFVEVYNNALRDLLGGPHAPFINDQSAIKHDSNGGHTHVAGVSRVRGGRARGLLFLSVWGGQGQP